MTIKHRAYQFATIISFAALVIFLVLIFNSKSGDDRTVLYMSLFLFSCIVFYYSSKKYIAYEVKKRKARRSVRRHRGLQQLD